MICSHCTSAGDLTNVKKENELPTIVNNFLDKTIHTYHSHCRGNTQCDCQHRINTVIYRELKQEVEESKGHGFEVHNGSEEETDP